MPRTLLGIDGDKSFVLNFKWSDNMQVDGDILDFYVNGDVAPEGRFKYQLAAGEIPAREADKANTKGRTDPLLIGLAAGAGVVAAGALAAAIALIAKNKKKQK